MWRETLAYVVLALLVTLPMLRTGYILTLDMVFTPKQAAPTEWSNNYIRQEFVHLVGFLLPGQILEKGIIFSILFFCGFGMHYLLEDRSLWARYFGGIFYTINPFTYERWMAGQYLILAGYALLPFILKSLLSFVAKPDRRNAVRLAAYYVILSLLTVQILVLAGVIGLAITAAQVINQKTSTHKLRLIYYGTAIASLIMALNATWLTSTSSPINQTINNVNNSDLSAFTTAVGPHGNLFFNVLTMYGFWLERYKRYVMPNTNTLLWIGLFLIFTILIGIGIISQWRQQCKITIALLICGLIGFIMACGISPHITGPLVRWIIMNAPLMKGFREPEKFSALLVLVYVYFASYGLDRLLVYLHSWSSGKRELLANSALILPVLYVSTMPFGFVNQLKPVNYPASWYSFNQQLLKHPASGAVLFLPWHEYMSYDFSSRIIANPGASFFYNTEVIAGTDAQFGGLNDPHPTATSRFIEEQALAHTSNTNLGNTLAKINVQYVLVAHGYDYNKYSWVKQQRDLKLLSNRPGLEVFLNEAYHHG